MRFAWAAPILASLLAQMAAWSPAMASAQDSALPRGSHYVALGSSFASGPGIAPPTSGGRCMRSSRNYAALLARALKLVLVDASCSGARTDHVLGSWGEIPAQIDALSADTRLVTVTIGGNDVGYIGSLIGASCQVVAGAAGKAVSCPPTLAPSEADWDRLESNLGRIAEAVRARAPAARLIFLQYPRVLPDGGEGCAALPLPPGQAEASRAIAARLADITARAAAAANAGLVAMDTLSRGHDVCSAQPWIGGFGPISAGYIPYHPNLAGMTAQADELARALAAQQRKPA